MTQLYLMPGSTYHVVDALITNFHVPRSTLMMLVSALATRDQIMDAYAAAIEERYRFFSFGDAMLILQVTAFPNAVTGRAARAAFGQSDVQLQGRDLCSYAVLPNRVTS